MNDQQVDTLRVINVLYRHMAEKHCHHTYASIIKEALEYKSGLGNQPNPAEDTDIITQGPTRDDYRDKIDS